MATQAQHLQAQDGGGRPDEDLAAQRTPISTTRAEQRSRLLTATVEVVAQRGYPELTVADIVRVAEVSRATFYLLFENREACLLAAQAELDDRLGHEIEAEIVRGPSAGAAQSAIRALVTVAEREPLQFDFVFHATMLAGRSARLARDLLVARFEHAIERAWERARKGTPFLDMSARFMLEATIRLLNFHRLKGASSPAELLGELLAWAECYVVPDGPPRWRQRATEATLLDKRTELLGTRARRPARASAKGSVRSDIAKGVQREQIVYATAEAIRKHGYAELTVAAVVDSIGLSRDSFYVHFHDKDEAFDGVAQVVFEELLARMAGAFFGDGGSWADQLWEAGWAFEQFLEEEPSLAHFLFVATYAPPARIGRVLDFVMAFALFVEEGNRSRPATDPVPRTIVEVIVCAVLEVVDSHIRRDRVQELRGLVPAITYMVFAPFLGAREACAFVDAKVAAEQPTGA